jgi:acetyl-CoA acetyltransferase
MAKTRKGVGFAAAQNQIAKKQGISQKRAGAILAASTRNASKAAKKRNPNLKKVK